MAIWVPSKLMSLERWLPSSVSSDSMSPGGVVVAAAQARRREKRSVAWLVAVNCVPLGQLNPENHRQIDDSEVLKEDEEGVGIMCKPCNGRGWLICEFCKGQKTNVKADNNRIYHRCPSCKAVGYVVCSKCKVFKCVTYPDYSDGEL